MAPASHSTRSYQCSSRTSLAPRAVLDELAGRQIPDVEVSERGPSYLVLEPPHRRKYGLQTAVFLSIAIVIVALVLAAVTPVLAVLIFAGLLPFVPLAVGHSPSLAVSAVSDPDGATRINAHGEASPELAAALDAFVAGLPQGAPPLPSTVAEVSMPPLSAAATAPLADAIPSTSDTETTGDHPTPREPVDPDEGPR